MIPKTAIIRSGSKKLYDRKICGLYPIERSIRILYQAGVSRFVLLLNDDEADFYMDTVSRRLASFKDAVIELNPKKIPAGASFDIHSDLFMLYPQAVNFEKNFVKKGKSWVAPAKGFISLRTDKDFADAEKIALDHVRKSAGGIIARNINKRISLPISRILARTGVSPNVLTFINMVIMLAGVALIFKDTYWSLFASGVIIQLVSIFDGCDGEVAKLTIRFSKFGAWFDTFSDYLALFLYLAGFAYIFALHAPLYVAVGAGVLAIGGAVVMVVSVLYYLHYYSISGSFVAYARDFTDKLPLSDPLIRFIRVGQYFVRKECYSWIVFFLGIFGLLRYIILLGSVITVVGAILVVMINRKYLRSMPKKKQSAEMAYISRR